MSLLLLLRQTATGLPVATDALSASDSVTRSAILSRRAFTSTQPAQRFAASDDVFAMPHVFTRQFTGARAIAQGLTLGDAAVGAITSGTLPIGGNEALRGPQAYTLLTPTAIVQAPYGLAQVQIARDAAGVNGTMRFPHAGSPYPSMTVDMTKAGQTWQFEQATTRFSGVINIRAADCTIEGGTFNNGRIDADGAIAAAPRFTLRNTYFENLSPNVACVNTSNHTALGTNWLVSQVKFTDNGSIIAGNNNFRNLLTIRYPQPGANGLRVEHCIIERAAGHGGDMISGSDNPNEAGDFKNFVVHNCRFDGGLNASGYFGIEMWSHVPGSTIRSDGLAAGGIVQYSDLKGGSSVLMSMVRSQNNWIHHNILRNDQGFGCYESSGDTETGLLFEYNQVIGRGSAGTEVIYHNNQAKNGVIRLNKIADINWVVGGFPDAAGGGYDVRDNCVTNVTQIIKPGFGIACTQSNNTSNACGY